MVAGRAGAAAAVAQLCGSSAALRWRQYPKWIAIAESAQIRHVLWSL